VEHGIEPFIAVGRQPHHEALEERLAPVPEAPPNPDAMGAMQHRLKTKGNFSKTPGDPLPNGSDLWYSIAP
jgi:hypothetical protein